MRVMLNIKFPNEPFNAAVRDGTASAKMARILDAIKPEAAYFTDHHGLRSGIIIVDLPDASKIPALAEPWFLTFSAEVQFHPVMVLEDLKKANLEALGKQWGWQCLDPNNRGCLMPHFRFIWTLRNHRPSC